MVPTQICCCICLQTLKDYSKCVRKVWQCHKALSDISTWHTVGLYWVHGHARVRGNEPADKLTGDRSVQQFVGPEPLLVVSRQNTRRKIKHRMENLQLVLWPGPCSTQRQARELISGPELATRAQLLSFNRTQSKVVTGLLTGHNTLWRHLHTVGLGNNCACRKCGAEEETSVHILCECEALASLRHTYLGSFFLYPEDIKRLSIGAIWNCGKGTEPF